MNKRDVRDRILEILESSDTDASSWDPEVRAELAEELATSVIKMEMESIFDMDLDDDEDDSGDLVL